MKRFKLLVIAMVVVVMVFTAAGAFSYDVTELTGYDWLSMTYDERIVWMEGFLVAGGAYMKYFYNLYERNIISYENYRIYEDILFFPEDNIQMVDRVNLYYSVYDLNHTVWSVIMAQYNKSWWR